MNICLGRKFTASGLRFQPYKPLLGSHDGESHETEEGGTIPLKVGQVLFHRGQHRHEALPLRTGERINLLIWLFAKDGNVRIAPYDKLERPSQREIWTSLDGEPGLTRICRRILIVGRSHGAYKVGDPTPQSLTCRI